MLPPGIQTPFRFSIVHPITQREWVFYLILQTGFVYNKSYVKNKVTVLTLCSFPLLYIKSNGRAYYVSQNEQIQTSSLQGHLQRYPENRKAKVL